MRNNCAAVLTLASGIILFLTLDHQPARWTDAATVNYFLDPAQLGRDTLWFTPQYFQSNPYFFADRFAAWCARVFGLGWAFTALNFLSAFAFPAALLYVYRAFGDGCLRGAILVALAVLNVHLIDLGSTELISMAWNPGNIGAPVGMLAVGAFLRGKVDASLVLLALTFWIHLPTAVMVAVPMAGAMLVDPGVVATFRKHWRGTAVFILAFMPFAALVLRLRQAMATNEPWLAELARQVAAGHVSLMYRTVLGGVARLIFSVSAAVLLLLVLHALRRETDEPRRASFRRAELFVVSAGVGFVVSAVLVDVFHVSAIYPLQLLRLGHFPSTILLAVIVAAWRPILGTSPLRKPLTMLTHAGAVLVLIYLAAGNTPRLRVSMLLGQSRDADPDWPAAAKLARTLPADACVLVPYEKVDFNAYTPRISPFNRYYVSRTLSNPTYIGEVVQRFDDFIAPNYVRTAVDRVVREPAALRTIYEQDITDAWLRLDDSAFQRLIQRYRITHVVIEADRQLAGSEIGRSGRYKLMATGVAPEPRPCRMPLEN